jgi:hypothetical protein
VFEHRVLRRIFGPKRYEIRREWSKIYNENLNGLYSPPNIVWDIKLEKMRWVGGVASMVDRTGAYTVLAGTPDGKKPFGRPRCRWEDKN